MKSSSPFQVIMNLQNCKEVIATCLFFVILVLYVGHPEIGSRRAILTKQLEDIKQQYQLLFVKHELLSTENKHWFKNSQRPSVKYEETRRRIYSNIKELWNYINHAMQSTLNANTTKATVFTVIKDMGDILRDISNRKISLLSDMQKMAELDGWHDWRKQEAAKVSKIVQKRLHDIQKLSNCTAFVLHCSYEYDCRGSGCILHRIVLCLAQAYGAKRSVFFDADRIRIFSVIKPILDPCKSAGSGIQYGLQSRHGLTIMESYLHFQPPMVPNDLAFKIQRFNGDPTSWWVGQLLTFALKVKPDVQADIDKAIIEMDFKSPIVGVHIRRTDKVYSGEAAFHNVSEYMVHVKDYYDQLELTKPVKVRRVFLATDDIEAAKEASLKYPEYTFLYDLKRVMVAVPNMQQTQQGMKSAMVDLHLLSMCDYLVCTFSSSMCRKAYELMQANRVDASNSFVSLDDIYFVCGHTFVANRLAVMSNTGGNKEISFRVGDLISVAGNHWNGYGKGTNTRTKQEGLFPWYKTVDYVSTYDTSPRSARSEQQSNRTTALNSVKSNYIRGQ